MDGWMEWITLYTHAKRKAQRTYWMYEQASFSIYRIYAFWRRKKKYPRMRFGVLFSLLVLFVVRA